MSKNKNELINRIFDQLLTGCLALAYVSKKIPSPSNLSMNPKTGPTLARSDVNHTAIPSP